MLAQKSDENRPQTDDLGGSAHHAHTERVNTRLRHVQTDSRGTNSMQIPLHMFESMNGLFERHGSWNPAIQNHKSKK
jgi:hypothetical protein